MKKFILYLFSIYLTTTCLQAQVTDSSDSFYKQDQDYNKAIEAIIIKFQNPLRDIDENLRRYTELTTIFNEFKAHDISLGQKLLDKVNRGDPLSGDDLYYLKRTIGTYYRINKKMLDFAKVYDFGGFQMSSNFATANQHLPLVKAHLLYISGHIQVLDHIVKMHKLYYESSGLFRRIIKNALKDKDDLGEKTLNDLIKMSEYTIDIGNSKKFANQINLVLNIQSDLRKILSGDPSAISMIDTIATNDSSHDIARGKHDYDVSYHSMVDTLAGVFNTFTNWLSGVFGNVAGSIRWRKGFLYKNETALQMMNEKLRPMDILLEKSPFVLTDKFIPGHYGHVAIYLGTRKQLEAIDMWNHPSIIQYQEEIEKGNVILEAVRPGVKLSTLEDFSNIDEVTIVRKHDSLENADVLIESISRGMDQIGKSYDFNFDVETLDKIVCSELIYIVFGQVHWPTKYRLARSTITPDDVAEVIFQKDTKFNIEQYLVSPERHRIEIGTMEELGKDLNFELRDENGGPVVDKQNPTNWFWKKSEKCYTVQSPGDIDKFSVTRECKTSYTLEYYEERVVGN